jgi:iron complex outermembrane receptor protein
VHRFELGSRQNIVWGAGFRDSENVTPPTFIINPNPQRNYTTIYNVFAQDDVTAVPDRLHLILGSKLDHTTYSGVELQPSGRMAWTPSETQTAWMAVSRAVTTPSLLDEAATYNQSAFPSAHGPVLVSLVGNPNFQPEQELAYELGYRLVPTPKWSFDLATYYNVYKGVQMYQPGTPFVSTTPTPHIVMPEYAQNALSGHTYGTELSAQWKPVDYWRLMASYSWLHMKLLPVDSLAGSSPQNQFQIRSYLDLTRNLNLSTALYYVDRLPGEHAPSYFGLNLGLNWQINKSWEVGVFGQNLIGGGHAEFSSDLSSVLTEIPRSVYVRLSWKF